MALDFPRFGGHRSGGSPDELCGLRGYADARSRGWTHNQRRGQALVRRAGKRGFRPQAPLRASLPERSLRSPAPRRSYGQGSRESHRRLTRDNKPDEQIGRREGSASCIERPRP
jgi:hypothetical protein